MLCLGQKLHQRSLDTLVIGFVWLSAFLSGDCISGQRRILTVPKMQEVLMQHSLPDS
jgi:hypothetical protein